MPTLILIKMHFSERTDSRLRTDDMFDDEALHPRIMSAGIALTPVSGQEDGFDTK